MTCYMMGFGNALFLNSLAKGIAPRKPRKNNDWIGGDEE